MGWDGALVWSAKEKASDDESLVMHLECGIMRKGGDN